MIAVLIRNAINALQIFASSLKSKVRDLKREKLCAETLIYQMLPKSVAGNLKETKKTSELFESATLCFSEFDEFRLISCNYSLSSMLLSRPLTYVLTVMMCTK